MDIKEKDKMILEQENARDIEWLKDQIRQELKEIYSIKHLKQIRVIVRKMGGFEKKNEENIKQENMQAPKCGEPSSIETIYKERITQVMETMDEKKLRNFWLIGDVMATSKE